MDVHLRNLRRHLLHPWYLVALFTLIANDRLLKEAYPGVITGKLSDFAGVFVVAVALGAVTGRRKAAVVLTGLGFAAIKLSTGAAVLAAPVLGGVTLQDPTDLVALAILAPVHRFLAPDRLPARPPNPSESIGARLDRRLTQQVGPIDARFRPSVLARRVGLLLVLSATTLGVTATSCIGPSGFGSFIVVPDGVVAIGDNELVDHISTDGGRTWQPWQESFNGQPLSGLEACLDGDRCFRVIPDERVEQRTADGWTTAFEFTEDELDSIIYNTGACEGPGLFRSILAIDAGPDSTVLVAMGNDGVLRLDPADGSWTRIGVGDTQPKDLNAWIPGDALRTLTFLTPLLVAALSPALLFIRRRSVGARWRVPAFVVCLVACIALLGLSLLSSLSVGASQAGIYRFGAGAAMAAVVIGVAALAVVLLAPRSSNPAVGAPTPPPRTVG